MIGVLRIALIILAAALIRAGIQIVIDGWPK